MQRFIPSSKTVDDVSEKRASISDGLDGYFMGRKEKRGLNPSVLLFQEVNAV